MVEGIIPPHPPTFREAAKVGSGSIDVRAIEASVRTKSDAELLRDAIVEQGRALEDAIAVLRGALYLSDGQDEALRGIQARIEQQRKDLGA